MTAHEAKRIAKVQRWVDTVCARMHVASRVVVDSDVCDDGAHGQILRGGMCFMLRVEPDFFARSPDFQRAVLVHELAHTYFAQMDDVHEAMVEHRMSHVDAETLKRLRLDAEHTAIERITNALAPCMPMPKF